MFLFLKNYFYLLKFKKKAYIVCDYNFYDEPIFLNDLEECDFNV